MSTFYKWKDLHRAAVYGFTLDAKGKSLPNRESWEPKGTAVRGEVSRKLKSAIKKQGYAWNTILVTDVDTPVRPALAKRFKATMKKKRPITKKTGRRKRAKKRK